jgi:hypothetical protein
MSKQSSNQQQLMNQSKPVELNDQQLDNVAGGVSCCNGKHFAKATLIVRRAS